MKIRADFVTNSSSSSFVSLLIIDSKTLADYLNSLDQELSFYYDSKVSIDGSKVSVKRVEMEQGEFFDEKEVPITAEDMIKYLLKRLRISKEIRSDAMDNIKDFAESTEAFELKGTTDDEECQYTFKFNVSYNGEKLSKRFSIEDYDE